jgi:hypothetical protein
MFLIMIRIGYVFYFISTIFLIPKKLSFLRISFYYAYSKKALLTS